MVDLHGDLKLIEKGFSVSSLFGDWRYDFNLNFYGSNWLIVLFDSITQLLSTLVNLGIRNLGFHLELMFKPLYYWDRLWIGTLGFVVIFVVTVQGITKQICWIEIINIFSELLCIVWWHFGPDYRHFRYWTRLRCLLENHTSVNNNFQRDYIVAVTSFCLLS